MCLYKVWFNVEMLSQEEETVDYRNSALRLA